MLMLKAIMNNVSIFENSTLKGVSLFCGGVHACHTDMRTSEQNLWELVLFCCVGFGVTFRLSGLAASSFWVILLAPLGKLMLPNSRTLLFCWLRSSDSGRGSASPRRHNKPSIEQEAKTVGSSWCFWVSKLRKNLELGRVLHPDYQGKEEPLECPLMFLCSGIKVNEKQQPNPGRMLNGRDSSGMTYESPLQVKNQGFWGACWARRKSHWVVEGR